MGISINGFKIFLKNENQQTLESLLVLKFSIFYEFPQKVMGSSKAKFYFSAANFCFNKGLSMIRNKGNLSEDKSC